jgi:hypothetical protein
MPRRKSRAQQLDQSTNQGAPFEIQPGDSVTKLFNVLGKPHDDWVDEIVGDYEGGPVDQWRGAAYWLMVPIKPTIPGAITQEASINMRFRYRTDIGAVWSVGLQDSVGGWRRGLGKLFTTTRLEEALTHRANASSVA